MCYAVINKGTHELIGLSSSKKEVEQWKIARRAKMLAMYREADVNDRRKIAIGQLEKTYNSFFNTLSNGAIGGYLNHATVHELEKVLTKVSNQDKAEVRRLYGDWQVAYQAIEPAIDHKTVLRLQAEAKELDNWKVVTLTDYPLKP